MRLGFVTAGTWCLDRNISIDFWPREDMVATTRGIELAGGGSACNFAVDIRRLDPSIPVATQGLIGRDAAGDFLVGVAQEYGIDHSGLLRSETAPSQTTDAYASLDNGRRTHIVFNGAGDYLSPEHFDFSKSAARVMHLGLPGIHKVMDAPWHEDANGWVTVLRKSRAAGLLNDLEFVSGPATQIRHLGLPCLPLLDSLVVNDHEIGALADLPTVVDGKTELEQVKKAVDQALLIGSMQVVAVHFTMGAYMKTRDGTEIFQPSVTVPDFARKGANGAGDAFSAGFHYGLHQGWSGQHCLKLAHAAAASCLRSTGTYTSVGTVQECLDLAQKWGWRSGAS